MSDETLDSPEVITTPAEAETAPTEQETTPEPVNDDTATSTEEDKPSRAEQRIQQLVGDRNSYKEFAETAERERNYWKQQAEAARPQAPDVKPLVKPKLEDFDHDLDQFMAAKDVYDDHVITQRVNAGISKSIEGYQQQTAKATQDASWNANVAKFKEVSPDFESVAFATESIYSIIKGQENGPEIAYHLGQNPAEAQRIGSLPASQQAFELGKLKMSPSKPAAKQKTTQAPEPPNPVGGQQPNTSVANESIDDFMKRRRAEKKAQRA